MKFATGGSHFGHACFMRSALFLFVGLLSCANQQSSDSERAQALTIADQDVPPATPLLSELAAGPLPITSIVIPAATPVVVFLDQALSSKDAKQQDRFSVTVLHDVVVNGRLVIAAGSKGSGEVLFANDRGAFGRGGLLDVRVNQIDADGIIIPVRGRFRKESSSNNTAAVATWLAVGVFSAFITGKNGAMPQGQELKTMTIKDVTLTLK